ncbi:hypothetical protein [Rhodovulum sp. P5]|uniref:hypothetical protein n=1 Tax=Rhodovulum sp. P5 TaxID=1564506 RepID=UPI0012EB4A89|nr:hypothetical protein [Rhodovulum sp. P5]
MNDAFHPIIVAADFQLVQKPFYIERVWKPARAANKNLPSSVAWLNALELVYSYHGKLRHLDGSEYDVPEIDAIFVDGENRWMRNFLEADATGAAPRRFSRQFERLRLIELYCRLIERGEWWNGPIPA